MQPAVLPEFLALLRLAEIALSQPRGTQYQLALGFAIVRQEASVGGHDRRLDHRHRHTGLDPVGGALIFATGQQLFVDMGTGDQRAGFRHAVGGRQLNTASLGGLVQRAIQGAAANDQLPAAKVDAGRALGVEDHLQDGRHTVGEGHLLALPQVHQQLGIVAPRIDLFDPEHGRHIRQAPGVHMEHRGDRHIDIIGAHQANAVEATHCRRGGQGVQHQLPMGEVHTLRIARSAGGVEGGSHRVFVKIGKGITAAGGGQQVFILTDQSRKIGSLVFGIGQQQGLFDRGQLAGDAVVERYKLAVHQHEFVVGVIHGVENLVGRQANVDGVQHRTNHRDGEHALQVTVAVPIHHRNRITGTHASLGQNIGQTCHALVEGGIAVAQLVAVNDLASALITAARQQQALDQQGILVGIGRRRDDSGLQHGKHLHALFL